MNLNLFLFSFVSMSISFYGLDFILSLMNITVDKSILIPIKIVLGIALMIGIFNLFKIILNKYAYKDTEALKSQKNEAV